jgi:hypothetical protein
MEVVIPTEAVPIMVRVRGGTVPESARDWVKVLSVKVMAKVPPATVTVKLLLTKDTGRGLPIKVMTAVMARIPASLQAGERVRWRTLVLG